MARWPTLTEDHTGARPAVCILDQTCLPAEVIMRRLDSVDAVATAIATMQVRGAPLIGVTAAYGVALGLQDDTSDEWLAQICAQLAATRPTAVNLQWALRRMQTMLQKSVLAGRRSLAWQQARALAEEDRAANAAIGEHGAELLARLSARSGNLQLMTHCNAGRLATVDHGTALAPVYARRRNGHDDHVWVSETRPRNQGLLTAWELADAGVRHTLIADNAAGLLLRQQRVDAVIVGADRIAANGDVANKVGTYLKALATRAAGVPFYVAAPCSTLDFACPDGDAIPIELRAADELGVASPTPMYNPAFDITPAELVTAVISERGVAAPAQLSQWR